MNDFAVLDRSRRRPRAVLLAAVVVAFAVTTAPTQSAPQAQPTGVDGLAQLPLRVPLHTQPADPGGVEYGLWAAGPHYKASFHDGFAFYPVRGDKSTVRLQWHTESVRCGEVDLANHRPTAMTTDWRHELRYGTVSEVYDILAEGVEQSFVLHSAPASGDVVVVGRVTTELHAATADAAVQDLCFCENGETVIRYGEALAFDSGGRRVGVTSKFDGERVELRLDGEFLRDAIFPVTIDPLVVVSPSISLSTTGSPVVSMAVASDNSIPAGRVLVVYSRQHSNGDTDAYGYRCTKTFGSPRLVYSDIGSWDSVRVDATHIAGASVFTIVTEVNLSSLAPTVVRIYNFNEYNTSLNSGSTLMPSNPIGWDRHRPQVGGSRTGTRGAVVFEEERANGVGTTRVRYISFQASFPRSWNPPQPISNSGNDASEPSICNNSQNTGWYCTWVEHNAATSALHVARINSGPRGTVHTVLSTADAISSPKIAGTHGGLTDPGRFMLAWLQTSSRFNFYRLRTVRIDASNLVASPVFHGIQSPVGGTDPIANLDLAYDFVTRSHWAATYTVSRPIGLLGRDVGAHVIRMGHKGGVTESQRIWSSTTFFPDDLAVTMTEGQGGQEFAVAFSTETSSQRVRGALFSYPSSASTSVYGSACASSQISATQKPYAGHEFFEVVAEPVGLLQWVFWVIGFNQATLPTAIPGCTLLVNPLVTVGMQNISVDGKARYTLPLPDRPLFTGDLYFQAAVLSGQPFLTAGLKAQVR